jgi:lysyl-tRNA synthetase, class II
MFEFDKRQLKKLSEMRAEGVDPYPVGESGVMPLSVIDGLREFSMGVLEGTDPVRVFGRVRFKNEMGKLGFGRIEDDGGRVQICVRKNEVSPEAFKAWKRLDLGDWVYVSGTYGRTRSGELTIFVTDISLASKCVSPMPDKLSGFTDVEQEYRKRYLHLAVSSEARDLFKRRSNTVSLMRRMLEGRGFMEVETPMLHSIPGGALAKPFVTHHNALNQEMFLRIAPELHLKRLLVGGFPRVFEINRCFRNEGIGTKYNPEFTTVELYQAHATYDDLIELISIIVSELGQFASSDNPVDFDNITRIRFDDAIRNLGIEDPWNVDQLRAFWVANRGESESLPDTVGDWYDIIFDAFIQDTLIDPTFITNHPSETSPLARKTDGDSRTVDRFELYIRGMEVSDGWTELNDPVEQAENFVQQLARREGGDEEAMLFDEDFVRALSYGMPPAAGVGLGIDRLMMVLCNKKSIRDVILFPTLRRE